VRYPTKDCQCEDFPCCEHADNFPAESSEDYYCDQCGFSHVGECPNDLEDDDEVEEELECLNAGGDNCVGAVEYRMALTTSGKPFPRCEKHWLERLKQHEKDQEKYPDSPLAPSWFDPTYAGERWDED
jgi:hypothetical protein